MITISRVRLWVVLVLLALVSCRAETSAPQHMRASYSVSSSVPSDAGVVIFRNYPLPVTPCLRECYRGYHQCLNATPECEAYARLQTSPALWRELSGRAYVCVQRCGEPWRLCDRQCFDAVRDAAPPLPP